MSSVQTGRSVATSPVPQPRPNTSPSSESYTVKSGDSLWNIAKDKYGDGMKWKDIYADNKDLIGKNPDLIHPGMQLQLKGTPAAQTAEEASAATTTTVPETGEAPETTSHAPAVHNEVADVPTGSAAPSVDLFAEETETEAPPANTLPADIHPEIVEEPAISPEVPTPPTEIVTPAVEVAPTAEVAPTVQSESPAAPEAPAPEAAPALVASEDTPPITSATPSAPNHPTVSDAPPLVESESFHPAQAQAEAILKTIDGKGYTVSHHGDPVGGIPKVIRAMDDVLAMSASGDIEKLPDGATKDKMNQWAQDIVSGRLAQAGRQFDGVTEHTTTRINDLINHPAFAQLPQPQQERLLNGLQSGFEMMGYLPTERLSESAKQLQTKLSEHFGTPPAQPPTVQTTAPQMPSTPAAGAAGPMDQPPATPPEASSPQASPAPVTTAVPQAPAMPSAEAAPIVDTTPANPELDRASALLQTIDGKGYTVSHHGDPVGGIPKVIRAMDDVLAMSASGDIEKLPDGATKDKMNQWAQDIITGRLAQAGRQFDGVTERTTTRVNDLINHPAFAQLPQPQQERLLNGLQSGFEMIGYLPAERLSESAKQLQTKLNDHFGTPPQAPQTTAETAAATATETAPSFTMDELKNTLQEKVGLFGKGEHQSKLLTQGQALAAISNEQHQQVSQLLSDAQEYSVLAKMLEQSNEAAIAATLTHPDIRGTKVIEAAEDKLAGQLLTALANQKEVSVGAEEIIASTLANFDGIFKDREAPFEALMQSQAFEKLTADLQAKIKDLVKYW